MKSCGSLFAAILCSVVGFGCAIIGTHGSNPVAPLGPGGTSMDTGALEDGDRAFAARQHRRIASQAIPTDLRICPPPGLILVLTDSEGRKLTFCGVPSSDDPTFSRPLDADYELYAVGQP